MSNVICTYGDDPANEVELGIQITAQKCTMFLYHSTPLLQRCVPVNPVPVDVLVDAALQYGGDETIPGTEVSANDIINNGRTVTMQIIADLVSSQWIILGATFVSLVVCFAYLILMRYFARTIIWITILSSTLVLAGLSIWLYFYWQSFQSFYYGMDESLRTDMQTWELRGLLAAFIIAATLTVVILLITIFLRKRISIAIEIIREAAKAIGAMPLIGKFFDFNTRLQYSIPSSTLP